MSEAAVFARCLVAVTAPAQRLMIAFVPKQRVLLTMGRDDVIRGACQDVSARVQSEGIHAQRMLAQPLRGVALPRVVIPAARCADPPRYRCSTLRVLLAISATHEARAADACAGTFRHYAAVAVAAAVASGMACARLSSSVTTLVTVPTLLGLLTWPAASSVLRLLLTALIVPTTVGVAPKS